jgi:formylglycine-generating enzyme required for sulfatase activity
MRCLCLLLFFCSAVAFAQRPAGSQAVNHRDPQAAVQAPSGEFRDCPDCPVMMAVPAGSFLLGTSADETEVDRQRGESPPLAVTMARPFAIGKFEVTLGEFRRFAEATQYPVQGDCRVTNAGSWARLPDRSWQNPGFSAPQSDAEPVVCVSWDDARAYVDWLSKATGKVYRLPSETEWEYAARGGTSGSRYFGGHDSDEASLLSLACDYANVYDASSVTAHGFSYPNARCSDGYAFTAPVGSFKPNAFDLYDMLGNVREWLQDCYTASYRGRPADARAWQWAGGCELRGVRGGSWASRPAEVRSGARGAELQGLRQSDLGFRVARDL